MNEVIEGLVDTLVGNALSKHSVLDRMEDDAEFQFEDMSLTEDEKETILDKAATIIVNQLKK